MSAETSWVELDDYSDVPVTILLATRGSYGEKLLFLHPYCPPPPKAAAPPPIPAPPLRSYNTKKTEKMPVLKQQVVVIPTCDTNSLVTQFGLTSQLCADIMCVKKEVCDMPFEMKIDNIRFVGYPKLVPAFQSTTAEMFNIGFVLPANCEGHLVDSFQRLSKRLAIAIEMQQTLNGYFDTEEANIKRALDEWETKPEHERCPHPWSTVLNHSILAKLFAKIYDDVKKTGAVQIYVDDFVEVGFCVEPKAFLHSHLTPKNRKDIDKIVAMIRPYHGCLLLENVYPTPDGNPSVKRFLQYCSPDRSLEDLQHKSGIPLLQILLIVQHLLLWARAIVIYPLCDTNVYTSATRPKPLSNSHYRQILRFQEIFGTQVHLAAALAHFNPPARLDSFVVKKEILSAQHKPASVVVFLLRHQLIMQLHKFCYIMPPLSGTPLPSPPSSEKRIQDLKAEIDGGDLPVAVKDIVVNLCLEMLNTESLSQVKTKLDLFLRMAPFMKGEHHVEDIMYRLNVERDAVEEVISAFSLVLSTFHRPDHIAL